ncbi:hypothetical protein [Neptunicoccus cionae]|uniref:Uncharacterized protein n=1 Tax=Neptunicoccus cionae TaxID=2035344 RepID=A0A916QZ16_9RHOB|nr:hypothetical protein [Amylibacter cionae]GGA21264.1 hypothetical protein GCM10011498_22450 [Amylibacter cionae]
MIPLDQALLDAHAAQNSPALVRLYQQAGNSALEMDEIRGCFYLTHAYIYALEAGLPEAETLHSTLRSYGREA